MQRVAPDNVLVKEVVTEEPAKTSPPPNHHLTKQKSSLRLQDFLPQIKRKEDRYGFERRGSLPVRRTLEYESKAINEQRQEEEKSSEREKKGVADGEQVSAPFVDNHGQGQVRRSSLPAKRPSFKDLSSFRNTRFSINIMDMEEQARVSKFHSYVMKRDLARISNALNSGYDINCVDRWGRNAVMYASMTNDLDCLQLFHEKDTNMVATAVNAKSSEDGKTSIHWACDCKPVNLDFIRFLVEIGADLNAQDNEGQTPAYVALTTWNSNAVLNLLFQLGADVTWRDKNGKSYLDYCEDRVTSNGNITSVRSVKKTCKIFMNLSQRKGSRSQCARQEEEKAPPSPPKNKGLPTGGAH